MRNSMIDFDKLFRDPEQARNARMALRGLMVLDAWEFSGSAYYRCSTKGELPSAKATVFCTDYQQGLWQWKKYTGAGVNSDEKQFSSPVDAMKACDESLLKLDNVRLVNA